MDKIESVKTSTIGYKASVKTNFVPIICRSTRDNFELNTKHY
jgi:hypothetical protein